MKDITVRIASIRLYFPALLIAGAFFLTSCQDDGADEPGTEEEKIFDDAFSVKAGGSGSDYATAITTDADGNTYMTGQFTGETHFGTMEITAAAEESAFLAKFDQDGNVLWVKQGGTEGRFVKIDADGNVYQTGYFEGSTTFGTTTLTASGDMDMFLAKYNPSGTLLWAKKAGGSGYDRGYAIGLDGDGNSYVIGQFTGLVFFGDKPIYAGDEVVGSFLAKFDSDGETVWARSAGGSNYAEGNALVVTPEGESYIGGSFFETIKFGETTFETMGGLDIFLAKYDADGILEWAKQEGGEDDDSNRGLNTDLSGNVYLTGFFKGTATFGNTALTSAGEEDIFLVKYNSDGEDQWAVKAGGSGMDRSYSVNHDASGDLYLTGNFQNTVTFGSTPAITGNGEEEIFLVKYTTSGEAIWSRKAGGIGEDGGYSTSIDAEGNIYMGGYFQDVVDFGPVKLTSSGDHDIVLWKFSKL